MTTNEHEQGIPRPWRPAILPARWLEGRMGEGLATYKYPDGLTVIASEAREADGRRWVHVSVSRRGRLPSWDDLVAMKEIFLGTEAHAFQVIPPRSQHVNCHPNVLHLWHCLDEMPMPDFRRCGMI